jgi:hypothetical protein
MSNKEYKIEVIDAPTNEVIEKIKMKNLGFIKILESLLMNLINKIN